MDIREISFLSQMGMQVQIPNRHFFLRPICVDFEKQSWAERKRDALIWKKKKFIAFRNLVIKIILRIITLPLPFLPAYYAAYFIVETLNYKRNGVMIGIVLAEIVIICFIFLWEVIGLINSDPDDVILKRK